MKRLRKRGLRPRYFLVTELGSKTQRVHHHAILWLGGVSRYSNRGVLELFIKCWPEGRLDWQWVHTRRALGYTTKYVMKEHHYQWSKRPMLGRPGVATWERYVREHHASVGYDNAETVPGWMTVSVLNESTTVRIPSNDFKRLCSDLGVCYTPEEAAAYYRTVLGVPNGPLDVVKCDAILKYRRGLKNEQEKEERKSSGGYRTGELEFTWSAGDSGACSDDASTDEV